MRYRRPHALWQKHVQGSFANARPRRDKEAAKSTRKWKQRSLLPWNSGREEQKRIMGLKSGYMAMKRAFKYIKKSGYRFGGRGWSEKSPWLRSRHPKIPRTK